jgi:hypothetical protein
MENNQLECCLQLIYAVVGDDEKVIEEVFEKNPDVFGEEVDDIKKEALEIFPTAKMFYSEGEEADMRRMQEFRDRVLRFAGIGA